MMTGRWWIGLVACAVVAPVLGAGILSVGKGRTPVAVPGGGGGGSTLAAYGMNIPLTHPRLWYDDPTILASARTWADSNPFNASGAAGHDTRREQATECLLEEDATVCNTVADWAIAQAAAMPAAGVACDDCRWVGEATILAFDWAYDYFSPAERTQFIADTNAWVAHWREEAWGGYAANAYHSLPMYGNNYYWGYLRNEMLWCIASAGENASYTDHCNVALNTRWEDEFIPAAASLTPPYDISHYGGALPEGSQYGFYLGAYTGVPFMSAMRYGRNIYGETNFFTEAAYGVIYSTLNGETTKGVSTNAGYEVFPFNDTETWRYGDSATQNELVDFMQTYQTAVTGTNLAGYLRTWADLDSGTVHSPHVISTLPTDSARAFSNLPLDYYIPGIGFFYGRNSWASTGTAFHWILGQHAQRNTTDDATTLGHRHDEIGSFQIWRNGRWLARMTDTYGETVRGFGDTGTGDPASLLGKNGLMISGDGQRYNGGVWTVRRLQSHTDFAYANTEFTTVYDGVGAQRVERELVYVRAIDTFVVIDRLQTSGSTTKTWLAHFDENPTAESSSVISAVNGTQELRITHLLPATPTRRIVDENNCGGCAQGTYRLEVDSASETQTYFIHVMQAKAAADADLSPSLTDNGSDWTITLDGSRSLTINKGNSSSGGSITISGSTTNFTSAVQTLTVNTTGVTWN